MDFLIVFRTGPIVINHHANPSVGEAQNKANPEGWVEVISAVGEKNAPIKRRT